MRIRTMAAVGMIGLALVVLGSPAAGQPALGKGASAEESREMRVYDLRDLGAALPRAVQRGAAGERLEGGQSPFADEPRQERGNLDVLMENLAGATMAAERKLLDGVYAVEGTAEAHAALTGMLARVRELYGESYHVQVQAFSVDAPTAPAVGAAAAGLEAGAAGSRVMASVPRRTAVPLESTRRHSYISGWQPVVGNSAVGYDSESGEVTEGMRLEVMIGAGPEGRSGAATGELVQIRGELSRVELIEVTAPAVGVDGLPLKMFKPTVDLRLVQSESRIALDTPTVVSVLDGFEEGKVVVLVATVRKGARGGQ